MKSNVLQFDGIGIFIKSFTNILITENKNIVNAVLTINLIFNQSYSFNNNAIYI